MTNDFHLFPDSPDSDQSIDPDVALIAAYLARALSPVQVAAVEDRLATDSAFRDAVWPVIEAWCLPGELAPPSVHASTTLTTHRRTSMKRIAALIAVTALPVISLAQVASYVATHPNAPGHAMLQRIVSVPAPAVPSVKPAAIAPRPLAVQDTQRPRELNSAPTPTPPAAREGASAPMAPLPPVPNRAKVIDLVRQHHAAVARGDTVVDYVVMVVDAADTYLWSTYGSGGFSLEIGGDRRTAADRNAYTRSYAAEFQGTATAVTRLDVDQVPVPAMQQVQRGSAVQNRRPADTSRIGVSSGGRGGRGAAPLGGTSANAANAPDTSRARPQLYYSGWSISGTLVNQAYGLNEPTAGQSGIQGLPSQAVAAAELYSFRPAELTPERFKVMVVRLVAGTRWPR